MKVVRVEEYQLSETLSLSQAQFDALAAFGRQLTILSAGRTGLYRIKASSWVGDLLLPGMVLTIVPKVGPLNVLRMVFEGDGEAIPHFEESPLKVGEESIWDLLGKAVLGEFFSVLRGGLRHSYEDLQDNTAFLRGQMQFMQDFLLNTPVRTGIFNRYSEFTPNNAWNQGIAWALATLGHLTSGEISSKLSHATDYLAGVDCPAACPDFELPDNENPYRRMMYLVSLVKRFRPTVTGSYGLRGEGLFVNMNDVFEGFVRARLRAALVSQGIGLPTKAASSKPLCERVKLEPDLLLVDRAGTILSIGDCKYKWDWDFSNPDVFQMLAYLEGYRPTQVGFIIAPYGGEVARTDSVSLPRNRRLARVLVPVDKLLDQATWVTVAAIIQEVTAGESKSRPAESAA